jgi:hypothetical protein
MGDEIVAKILDVKSSYRQRDIEIERQKDRETETER